MPEDQKVQYGWVYTCVPCFFQFVEPEKCDDYPCPRCGAPAKSEATASDPTVEISGFVGPSKAWLESASVEELLDVQESRLGISFKPAPGA